MKKCFLKITFLIALLVFSVSYACADQFKELSVGSKAAEVAELKHRLFDLGYQYKTNFSNSFTKETREHLIDFQRMNGLEETGILTEEVWDVLFSDQVVHAVMPTPEPYQAPVPSPEVEYPERDEEGYLQSDDEFIYENEEEGFWTYLNKELQVTILRRTDKKAKLTWFETEIKTRGDTRLTAAHADPAKPGRKYKYPYVIARDNNFVLAFSDDFYGDRLYYKKTLGIIIREGVIHSKNTLDKTSYKLPNLDVMAQFPDGTLKVFGANEHTAEEYLEMGVINTFAFGPIMIRDGEISSLMLSGHYSSKEPRQALGMIEPGHYLLVTVQGRTKQTVGCDLWHICGIMLDYGVREALNLDGGNTVALVFRGKMLNKPGYWNNKKSVRTVTSMIGIGYTEEMDDDNT